MKDDQEYVVFLKDSRSNYLKFNKPVILESPTLTIKDKRFEESPIVVMVTK